MFIVFGTVPAIVGPISAKVIFTPYCYGENNNIIMKKRHPFKGCLFLLRIAFLIRCSQCENKNDEKDDVDNE